jgi:hypothetical protein
MALARLFLKPGIDSRTLSTVRRAVGLRETSFAFVTACQKSLAAGRRFNNSASYLVGLASEVFTWNALDGSPYAAVGTSRKLYAFFGGSWADITPLRDTTDPGDVTFAASTGSTTITVSDTAHGATEGDFVTFSGVDASGLGGAITQAILQSEFEITSIINGDSYTITSPVAANGSDSGDGGAAVVGAYQINVGTDVSFFDFGWGVGSWGEGTWNTPRTSGTGIFLNSRVWQLDTFGEDLICQLVNGAIYRWDLSGGLASRATAISGAPTKSTYALVSTPDRHLVCFGTETTVGTPSTQDPMFVRFSNQEDINTFTETATNTAGGQRLTDGSRIVTAVRSRGQILIFTDTSLHGMQYVGPPYTFGFQQLGTNCGCIGPHAAADVNGLAFWMGTEAFYVFDGTVKKMPCTVQDFVFKDINLTQGTKTHVGVNSQFNEVTWWYCSFTSDFIDRFVTYNYLENTWHVGTMPRTAWVDIGTYAKPLAAEYLPENTEDTISTIYGLTAGRSLIYNQEDGVNGDGEAITAFIQSGYFDISEGDNMLFMKRFIPDFKDQVGNLTVNLLLKPFPQATASPSSLDPYVITPTTQKVDTRARGRQISLRIVSDAVDTNWRYGTLRVDVVPDGLR